MEVGSRLEGSYSQALKIWIGRFRQSQQVIRELEDENEALRKKIEELTRD